MNNVDSGAVARVFANGTAHFGGPVLTTVTIKNKPLITDRTTNAAIAYTTDT